MIVLFLFVFVAEESLTRETVDQSKKIRKAMRVSLIINRSSFQRELSSILRKSSSKSFTSYEQLLLAYDEHGKYNSMFRNRDLILAVIIYGMASLCQISFDSIYPLTLMNSRKYGGFEMNAVEEGWVATSAIVLQLTSSTDSTLLCRSSSDLPSVEQGRFLSLSDCALSARYVRNYACRARRVDLQRVSARLSVRNDVHRLRDFGSGSSDCLQVIASLSLLFQ